MSNLACCCLHPEGSDSEYLSMNPKVSKKNLASGAAMDKYKIVFQDNYI